MNKALQDARVAAGMTHQQLADAAAIPLQTYQEIETGETTVKFEDALRIAAALKVPVEKLFGGS